MIIRLALPYPPTVNNLYRNGAKGRFKTSGYKAWEAKCRGHADILRHVEEKTPGGVRMSFSDPIPTIAGPYTITYTAQRPDRRRRDIGNLEKACSDMLQALGVIRDDCDCERMTIQWAPGEPVGKSAEILVEITPA